LQRIERELGRVREEHWGARTLDLDLLLYDNQVINEPDLIVPHRFLPFRRFVLEPAVEVAAEMVQPTLERTVSQLLEHLRSARRIYEVGGLIESNRSEFAARVARALGLGVARREVSVGGRDDTEISVHFRDCNGMPLATRLDANFIAEDSVMELPFRSPLFQPLRWSQIAPGILKNLEASFWPTAFFQLDASNSWLISADRQVALLGANAGEYCDAFRAQVTDSLRNLHLPYLILPADDLDRAVREAVAAIQAMQ
jgi:hypothetical protein